MNLKEVRSVGQEKVIQDALGDQKIAGALRGCWDSFHLVFEQAAKLVASRPLPGSSRLWHRAVNEER